MMLAIHTPKDRIFKGEVVSITAEATNGGFGLLENHIDMVAPLTAGVLSAVNADGSVLYFGVDRGILVKCAQTVSVAAGRAVRGDDLADLRQVVDRVFVAIDEPERVARSVLARLEAGIMRRMLELERVP